MIRVIVDVVEFKVVFNYFEILNFYVIVIF